MSDEIPGPQDGTEWPFPLVPPEVYWALTEADRTGIEQIIRHMTNGKNLKH